MQLKDFMEAVNYRITEGSEFCWSCFGPNAYRLDSWNGDQDGYTISIVFDTVTQSVYCVEAWDYLNNRAYRWMNPVNKEAHDTEAINRNIDPKNAWDEVNFVDLEVEADFWEKTRAIVAGEEYDTRVQVEVEFDDEVLFGVMKMAHDRDITFNQLVEEVLRTEVDRLSNAKVS